MFKERIVLTVRAIGGLTAIRQINRIVRRISKTSHYAQFVLEWSVRPVPAWFDHQLDLACLWKKNRTPISVERGIFNLAAIKPGARVLDLCCGNGFYSYYFYAGRASQVVAIDLDKRAIDEARSQHRVENVTYICGDIRSDIPVERFDNVLCDASFEYLTLGEVQALLSKIKLCLVPRGVFSGHGIVQQEHGVEHHHIFRSKKDLVDLLKPHFAFIVMLETLHESRQAIYFSASESTDNLPPIGSSV
jgi:SAM-dependent methyltransferase